MSTIFLVQLDTFYSHQDYEQVKFHKSRVFISLVAPTQTGQSQPFYIWLKIGTFQSKFDKIYFFPSTSSNLYDVMQKIAFVQSVFFEFIDSLQNSGTKYFLTFDDSCEQICN